ncbi:MAG: transposase domain-containing protein [Magnetococcales bacterium]|nr:transposase domain-containing protein [Magnetococcales bacterium]
MEIDNNSVENAIRPFVIGRKGWLFSNSFAGAKASANLYRLIETAKASGLEPYAYLRKVFSAIPNATTVEGFAALLPWNCKNPEKSKSLC